MALISVNELFRICERMELDTKLFISIDKCYYAPQFMVNPINETPKFEEFKNLDNLLKGGVK